MRYIRTREQEAAEDIFFGQLAIIWARWWVIASLIVLILWSATDVVRMTIGMLLAVALMAVNFFLHGAYAMERPRNERMIKVVSVLDLIAVTGAIVTVAGHGVFSPLFVLYYPLILAFALVFPFRTSIGYTALAMLSYLAVCAPSIHSPNDLKIFVMRVVTLVATGALASFYWRIQRDRRRDAIERRSLPAA